MNAYNFFFRYQRCILLDERASSLDMNLNGYTVKTRRAHRKVHGRITLSGMAKFVAKKWRKIGQADLNYYRDLAKQDSERYKRDVKVYMSITDSFDSKSMGRVVPLKPKQEVNNHTNKKTFTPRKKISEPLFQGKLITKDSTDVDDDYPDVSSSSVSAPEPTPLANMQSYSITVLEEHLYHIIYTVE